MGYFAKSDIFKPKYITAIVRDIKSGKKIKAKVNNKQVTTTFQYNDAIRELEKVQLDSKKSAEILYPNSKYAQVFESVEGKSQFNHIDKAQYSGGRAGKGVSNKGDVSEGLLAASLFLRFMNKENKITKEDLIKYLSTIKPKKVGKIMMWEEKATSLNKNGVTKDTITLKIGLAEVHMISMLDKDFYGNELAYAIGASVKYANSQDIHDTALMLHENNQENTIEILAVGTEDQKGTKADLFIRIDNVEFKKLSLKYGKVKQFGQLGGTNFQKLNEFFGELGAKFSSSDEKTFYALLSDGPKQAFTFLYKKVSSLKTIEPKTITRFIKSHATLNEDVQLVQLDETVKVYDFDKLDDMIKDDIDVDLVTSKSYPELKFGLRGLPLFKIRMKVENKQKTKINPLGLYCRTYVEKDKAMDKISQII